MSRTELPSETFFQIAQDIWDAVFSANLEATDDTVLNASSLLASSIEITGSWEGIVVFRCRPALARELAGILFGPKKLLKPRSLTRLESWQI